MASSFDLQQYIEAYSGEGYIERLIFIASRSESLAPQALRLAIEAVKRTPNTGRYVELVAKLASLSPEDGILDTAWAEEKDRTEALALAALELELNQHLTAQNKEGSRVTLTRIGDHYFRRGDYDNALRNYLRPRTDCVTSDQILELYTNVVKASMALRRLTHVTSYVSKAECVKSQDNDQCQSLLSTFAGIALLDRGSFEQAALRFLSIKHANTEIVSAQDIATYGALCALATFTRAELKSQVLDSPHFKQFLELAPTVQMIVSDFYKSKYSSCFRGLEQLLGELDLDLYIHAQAKALLSAIRHKAILQYFSPFASVSLTSMARAFNTDVASIEKEVASIIAAGQLAGKIDSHSKILYASQTRRRQQTFQNALELASEYETNANALLLRVNLLKSDFVVKPPRKKGDMMGAGLFPTLATLLQFQ